MLKRIPEIKPEDIKNMSEEELSITAMAMRDFLVEKISKTGGHLASNLGAVELTLGIYNVFNPPKDKIIWDVGHQAYVHKILSGRAEGFDTLRKFGGISGFPKRAESVFDVYDTGHSSTSIAAALGMATARDLKGGDEEIIAVIGDGSLTGGLAFEGFNNLGNSNSKVIVILNDNGMSISKNTGGLSDHLSKLRTSTEYQNAKAMVKEAIGKIPTVGESITNLIGDAKDRIKYALLSGGVIFEELGLTYIGPVDGNDIGDVIKVLKQAKNASGPVIVHAITVKGKGYKPAEEDPNKYHGISAFDLETGVENKKPGVTFSEVFGDKMLELAERNDNLTAVTAAMCDATGLLKMKEKFPERVFDVGIAEGCGVVFAAGQALSGLHPVVAIYSSFLQRAYDNILEDVALQNLPVTFAIDRSGIVGADGETHHGIFDLSYLLHMPNLTILTPCDAEQLRSMLEYAVNSSGPTAIRYPRGEAEADLLQGNAFQGRNMRLKSGADVEILAVGTMLKPALDAVKLLDEKGIDAGITYIAIPKPYIPDPQLLGSKLIVTVEDNVVSGGFGESIAHLLPGTDIVNIGWPDKFIEHGDTNLLMKKYMLDAEGIAERIVNLFEGKA